LNLPQALSTPHQGCARLDDPYVFWYTKSINLPILHGDLGSS
jgi:hypothetical protein